MLAVRTVLGDVPAAELGVCDAHDHLFFRSAQLAGQELDDADAAVGELRAFAALGGRAVVAAGGRTRRGCGGEVLHREPGPRLQLGLKASAWAWAHWANVRGSRPVMSRTSGWGCDSSSVPVA